MGTAVLRLRHGRTAGGSHGDAATPEAKLRWELLTDGIAGDCVSLSLVDSRVHKYFPPATPAERKAITLNTIRSLVDEGMFHIGHRGGDNDRFVAFDEQPGASIQRIHDAYVTHGDDRLGWVYRFWLELTEAGRHVVMSTEEGRQLAQEVAETSKRALAGLETRYRRRRTLTQTRCTLR